MRRALLPEWGQLWCPACRRPLTGAQCVDPFARCLACSAGHRFFVTPEAPPAADTSRAASISLPQLEDMSPLAIAAFWLSDPEARSVLNEQLAELLRAILEDRRILSQPSFSHCPLCGEVLLEHEQPDIWVVGLRCSNGHAWASRGGGLGGFLSGSRFSLHAEAPDSTVAQLIAGWLKGNPQLQRQLHSSVRRVLETSRLSPNSAA